MIKTEIPRQIKEKSGDEFTVSMTKEDQERFNLFKGLQEKRSQDEVKYQRERGIKHSNWEIRSRERNIKFKQDQLANGQILETLSLRNEKTGLNQGFIDTLKPKWFLKNEIELLQMEIEDFQNRIKQIHLAEKEDKNVFTA